MQPFLDLKGRTLCIGGGVSTRLIYDTLLRLQNASDWERPITIYLGVGEPEHKPLSAIDALQICSLIQCLRIGVIRTVGLGLLLGHEPLVLAAGTPGSRFMAPQSLLIFGEAALELVAVQNKVAGLKPNANCPREILQNWCSQQTSRLLSDFGVKVSEWPAGRILPGSDALLMGFADEILSRRLLLKEPMPERKPASLNCEPHP